MLPFYMLDWSQSAGNTRWHD